MLNAAQKKALTSIERAVARAITAIPPISDDETIANRVLRDIESQMTNHLADVRARGHE